MAPKISKASHFVRNTFSEEKKAGRLKSISEKIGIFREGEDTHFSFSDNS